MRFIPNTESQRAEMLRTIAASSVEALFAPIPKALRLGRPLRLPEALWEFELTKEMLALAGQNSSMDGHVSFLGGGVYDHFLPTVVDHIISRSENYTPYTPYQPEASQGILRSIYEYQTMVAELTGMDVANASLYDGGSALAEAALMAHGVTGRDRLVCSKAVHPLYRRVMATYCEGPGLQIKEVPWGDGTTDLNALERAVTDKTAGVILQYPNFFGCLEELEQAATMAHRQGALLIVCVDPIAMGLLRSPGEAGADIVVGEGQSMAIPPSFGGPNLGLFACRQELVRRMPGRLVGATLDSRGQRGFVLTLQTREQHIRREKATSNICTNVALVGLAATVYLALVGKQGLRQIGELCLAKAHYAAKALGAVDGVRVRFGAPFFKEFVLELPKSPDRVIRALAKRKILPGLALKPWYRDLKNGLLVAVTEKRTREEIDAFASSLTAVL